MTDVLRFRAPGPWLTRDLKECVLASDYDALQADFVSMRASYEAAHEHAHQMLDRAKAAESRLAEAERDAARYRWLRDVADEAQVAEVCQWEYEKFDAAIDSGMASETVSPAEGER